MATDRSFRREDGIGEEALTLRIVRKGRSSTTDRRSLHQSDRSSHRTDEDSMTMGMLRDGRSERFGKLHTLNSLMNKDMTLKLPHSLFDL